METSMWRLPCDVHPNPPTLLDHRLLVALDKPLAPPDQMPRPADGDGDGLAMLGLENHVVKKKKTSPSHHHFYGC